MELLNSNVKDGKMTYILEEWFKAVELRLKYELSPESYEKVIGIMLAELKKLYEEEKTKNERGRNND
jgi:hypothetical protein